MDTTMFQSTRPRGARPWMVLIELPPHRFNPRAHAGRDVKGVKPILDNIEFQSTRPRGARHKLRILWGCL